MAETNPSLHIDTDWKKQAQEEKRKLAEQEQQKASAAADAGATSAATAAPVTEATRAAPAAPGDRRATRGAAGEARQRELPPASFATLVQTLVTQALFYLGGIATRGGEPVLDLDLAKHQIDLLGVLEQKTSNNLAPEEKHMLDAALYETRMRYISVASQYIS